MEKDFEFQVSLKTADFDDFYDMLDHFLVEYRKRARDPDRKIGNTTLAVAGPTDHESVNPTNIEGWEINTNAINSYLEDHGHQGYSSIINDFEALGYGILYLYEVGFSKDDVEPLYGKFRSGPTRSGIDFGERSIVCGPGTGLGIACLVDDLIKDGFPYIFSSEGGHHTLSPEAHDQYKFLGDDGAFNGKKSYEDALSHTGLQNMYNYFRREDYSAEPNYSISSEEIIFLATGGKDQAAFDTIELFCNLLANFCGNAALTFNCDKAIFLWGGTLRNIPRDLIKTRFKRYYTNRCSHSDRVSKVPVVILRRENLPLLGCVHRSKFEVDFLMKKDV